MKQRLQFVGIVATVTAAAFNSTVLFGLIRRHAYAGDMAYFTHYGLLGLRTGWPNAYSGNAPGRIMDLPFILWMYLPLTRLPWEAAAALWAALTLVAVVAAWWIAAPGRGLERALWLTAMLGSFPLAFALGQGQYSGVLVLVLAATLRLLREGRAVPAGLTLAIALQVKPSSAFLVLPALLLTGQWRTFAAAAAGAAVFAIAYLVVFGADFPVIYLHALERAGVIGHSTEAALPFYGGLVAGYAVRAALAVLVLLLAWRVRSPDLVLAVGIVGSLLVSPFVAGYDLLALFVAGWALYGRAKLLFVAGPPIWAVAPFTPLVAAWELLLLLGLALEPRRSEPSPDHGSAAPDEAPARRIPSPVG